jgi:hypothetical protein
MGGRASVQVSRNFERNLESIRSFLEEAEVPEVFGGLLDRLFDGVIPVLEEYPDVGIEFLARQPASAELRMQWDRLRTRMGGSQATLREYIADEYLILYAVQAEAVFLLAIKHHRQLSFDFSGIWRPGGKN